MILEKKYVIGTNIMWYEIEIYKEFIDGLCNMLETVDNKGNVIIDMCLNMQQHLEKRDLEKMAYDNYIDIFYTGVNKLIEAGMSTTNLRVFVKGENEEMYFHTDYRRNLNYEYCDAVDYIIWGETDSLIPREGLMAIETLAQYTDSQNDYNYIMSFADRKMWDSSWDATVHPDYINHVFVDDANGHLNPNQSKSQMSIEAMNKVNSKIEDFEFNVIPYTKIDGSFLVISANLVRGGVNIPKCLLYNDDEGFHISYNQLRPNKVKQYIAKNVLKVHARRHPNKRMYVLDENNEYSFNDQKGNGFQVFKELSQKNIETLHRGEGKFYTYNDLKNRLK
jgi:hypothetical protein